MATWNYGKSSTNQLINFNNQTFERRTDNGETVYDHTSDDLSRDDLQAQLESLRADMPAGGDSFGTIKWYDSDEIPYTRTINGAHQTVTEQLNSVALTMPDGSRPSAAIMFVNCVNLNDNVFDNPDKARAAVSYRTQTTPAPVTCFVNSRGDGGNTTSGTRVVSGTYKGDGTGKSQGYGLGKPRGVGYEFDTDGLDQAESDRNIIFDPGQHIELGSRPLSVSIRSKTKQRIPEHKQNGNATFHEMTELYVKRTMNNDITDGYLVNTTPWSQHLMTEDEQRVSGQTIIINDTGFEVINQVGYVTKSGYFNDWGPNELWRQDQSVPIEYEYTAILSDSTGSSGGASGKTYGPGTQCMVPLKDDSTMELVVNISKLNSLARAEDCYLQLWVVGLIGGGTEAPKSNFDLLEQKINSLNIGGGTVCAPTTYSVLASRGPENRTDFSGTRPLYRQVELTTKDNGYQKTNSFAKKYAPISYMRDGDGELVSSSELPEKFDFSFSAASMVEHLKDGNKRYTSANPDVHTKFTPYKGSSPALTEYESRADVFEPIGPVESLGQSSEEHLIYTSTVNTTSRGFNAHRARGKYTFDSDIHEAIVLYDENSEKSDHRIACIAPPYGIINRSEASISITLKNECPPVSVSSETNQNYSLTQKIPNAEVWSAPPWLHNEGSNNPSSTKTSGSKNRQHYFSKFFATDLPNPPELIVQRFDTVGVEVDWDTTTLAAIGGRLVKSVVFSTPGSDLDWSRGDVTSNIPGVPSVFSRDSESGALSNWTFTSDYNMAWFPGEEGGLLLMPYYDYHEGCPAIAYIFRNLGGAGDPSYSRVAGGSKDYNEINSVWLGTTVTVHVGGNDPHWNHHNYGVTQRNPGGFALYA